MTPPPEPPGPPGATEPGQPDDELVSAYLDDEVTPAERARVEGDPALMARARELAGAATLLARPPAPAPDSARDAAVGAALAARRGEATDGVPDGAPATTGDSVADLGAARRRRFANPRLGPLLTAAAGLLLLGLGAFAVTRLFDDGGGEEQDFALSEDETTASDLFLPQGADLGSVADDAELMVRLAEEAGLRSVPEPTSAADGAAEEDLAESAAPDTGPAEETDAGSAEFESDSAGEPEGGDAEGAEPRLDEDCEVVVVAEHPDVAGRLLRASVDYAGVDAEVLVFGDGRGGATAFVVRTRDCSILSSFPVLPDG